MAPRKKPKTSSSSSSSTSSKKSTQNVKTSQPSKFGIQHFFDRHHSLSSSSQNPTAAATTPTTTSTTTNRTTSTPSAAAVSAASHDPKPKSASSDPGGANSASRRPADTRVFKVESLPKVNDSGSNMVETVEDRKNSVDDPKKEANVEAGDLSKLPVSTPTEDLVANVADLDAEFSPDCSKQVPRKRFKFSPGMLIKQSQDDGGDEITWKITPVNERLQSMSKQAPELLKSLADASRSNFNLQQCSNSKMSPGAENKPQELSPLPVFKVPPISSSLSSREGLENVIECPNSSIDHREVTAPDTNNLRLSSQSPFRTPPSLSFGSNKLARSPVQNCSVLESLGFRQHKKALLELLDQVKDVISVEEPSVGGETLCTSQHHDRKPDEEFSGSIVNKLAVNPREDIELASCGPCFLVLEVMEKHEPVNPPGAQCSFKVLRLLDEQSGVERSVHLRDDWFYSVVEPGDTVHVIGEFDGHGKCDVNHEQNLLIVHPNVLVSGTRVAGSFSCSRRAVLDERLRCNEYSSAALMGSLLHHVFQAALLMCNPTRDLLEQHSRIAINKNMENLYACEVNENNAYKNLTGAIPRMLNWTKVFKRSQTDAPLVDFGTDHGLKRVCIAEVVDIEEMVWAPRYGLKGMIDASLHVRIQSDGEEATEKIVPLEFKTGKGTNGQSAMEHSAQVILYTILMSERYLENVESGLLYYLHTDVTQGTLVRRSDVLGLIMRRNELAHDIVKASRIQQLPRMLLSPSMCKGCHHLNACTIYHKVHGGGKDSSGLGDFFDSLTSHLTNSHIIFLKQWDRLIDLEAKEMQFDRKSLKRSHVTKNEDSPSCISSIVLDSSENIQLQNPSKDTRFVYRFVRQDTSTGDSRIGGISSKDDFDCGLRSGDYVILWTESSHLPVIKGFITDISRFHVSVSFPKRLRLPPNTGFSLPTDLYQVVWRIVKDEVATSFGIMRFNLVQLFLQSAQSDHLRKMIVDLEAPRFDSGCILSQDPAISYIWSERNLNDDQRRAIVKILTAKDYALILGMPGTGKTSTMVYAVKALLMRGASVLLTSYTNSAVDNLLIKLNTQGIDFVRIGRCNVVHEEIRGHCISGMEIQSVEELKMKLDQVKIVAVTCLGITSPLLANKKFDVCIMDEAGQTNLPVSLGPLLFASVFVLVGDHYQLPPLVQSAEAQENGMGTSLFCRLSEAHPQAISALQCQYRMCSGIMDLANALIYGDRLQCGSTEVANAMLKFSTSLSIPSWLKQVLNAYKPVIFVNTDLLPAFEAKDYKAVNNPVEAYIICEVVNTLINNGIEKENVGIITPYNSQANLIRQAVNMESMEVHTIDKYQGRDKDCILVSFVRSSQNPRNCSSSLLGDWHRINVALTRAKKKLIMVGSCRTLSKVPLLKLLIQKVEQQSGILPLSRSDINHKMELRRCPHVA